MKVTPVASAHAIQTQNTQGMTVAAQRATAKLNAAMQAKAAPARPQAPTTGNIQQEAVANPNQVSIEELSAITSQTTETPVESTNSEDTNQIEASADGTETTPATTEETPKTDPTLSRQFAQLARQEKALRAKAQQQAQELKQREEAIKAREEALTQSKPDMTTFISKDRLKSDPLSVLAEAGLSYEELTQQILTQQPRDPRTEAHIARLEAKLAALEEQTQTSQKTYQEQQQAQYQAAVKQIQLDAKKLVATNPDFETIKATGSVKDVVELITQTYEKDGVLLTVEEAAQQVEDYLIEEAMKLTQVDKIKKRMAAANASKPKPEVKTQAITGQTQPMKTLTNAAASQRQLSAKERAILAFKGELAKN